MLFPNNIPSTNNNKNYYYPNYYYPINNQPLRYLNQDPDSELSSSQQNQYQYNQFKQPYLNQNSEFISSSQQNQNQYNQFNQQSSNDQVNNNLPKNQVINYGPPNQKQFQYNQFNQFNQQLSNSQVSEYSKNPPRTNQVDKGYNNLILNQSQFALLPKNDRRFKTKRETEFTINPMRIYKNYVPNKIKPQKEKNINNNNNQEDYKNYYKILNKLPVENLEKELLNSSVKNDDTKQYLFNKVTSKKFEERNRNTNDSENAIKNDFFFVEDSEVENIDMATPLEKYNLDNGWIITKQGKNLRFYSPKPIMPHFPNFQRTDEVNEKFIQFNNQQIEMLIRDDINDEVYQQLSDSNFNGEISKNLGTNNNNNNATKRADLNKRIEYYLKKYYDLQYFGKIEYYEKDENHDKSYAIKFYDPNKRNPEDKLLMITQNFTMDQDDKSNLSSLNDSNNKNNILSSNHSSNMNNINTSEKNSNLNNMNNLNCTSIRNNIGNSGNQNFNSSLSKNANGPINYFFERLPGLGLFEQINLYVLPGRDVSPIVLGDRNNEKLFYRASGKNKMLASQCTIGLEKKEKLKIIPKLNKFFGQSNMQHVFVKGGFIPDRGALQLIESQKVEEARKNRYMYTSCTKKRMEKKDLEDQNQKGFQKLREKIRKPRIQRENKDAYILDES